jgi:hypothetical protein
MPGNPENADPEENIIPGEKNFLQGYSLSASMPVIQRF